MADFAQQPSLPEEKRRSLRETGRTQLARIEWLVSALLKMARLDAGAVMLKPDPVNASGIDTKSVGPPADSHGTETSAVCGGLRRRL